MKYMLLIYGNEQDSTQDAREKCYQESAQLGRDLYAKGQFIAAAPLHPTSTATSVKVRNGRRILTDGPFAETREQLGGYFLVEAKDLDEALDIAGRLPGARIGTVEVRPVIEVAGLPHYEVVAGQHANSK
ncbi:MAG: YciI family protein [Bryobacteraceae bacterium]